MQAIKFCPACGQQWQRANELGSQLVSEASTKGTIEDNFAVIGDEPSAEAVPLTTYPACSSCGWQLFDNPVPVVAAVVVLESAAGSTTGSAQVVLVRNYGWPEQMLGLVTGYLEKHESPDLAVAREVQEELNLSATRVEFLGHHTFVLKNQLLIGYAVYVDVDTADIRLNEELEAYKLIAADRLKGWDFGTGHIVQMYVDQLNASAKPFPANSS